MKRIIALLVLAFMVSCEVTSVGPEGPPGPEGPVGPVGQGFEVETSFKASEDYIKIIPIPDNIEVLRTDIVAAYWLFEVDKQTDNDVWQPLPVSIFFEDGQLQYGFDHTIADVRLFLTGDTNLDALEAEFTQAQIFRIVVLPVDYVESNKIDLNNIEEVMDVVDGSKNLKRIKISDK